MLNTILVHVNKSSVWILKFFTIVTHLDILPISKRVKKSKDAIKRKLLIIVTHVITFIEKNITCVENTSFSLQALDFCRDGH